MKLVYYKSINFLIKKIGFFARIFNYGTIKIVSKDENTIIWCNGIRYPNEVVQYISRLRDFLEENPGFDYNKLKNFKTKKERKKDKI